MKSICVFCGSSKGTSPKYVELARSVGKYLAEQKIKLVYGAGNIGLMGEAAEAALKAGGEVLGVIPQFLKHKEVYHTGLTELVITTTMHERKWIMDERSDGVIVLPGGFGTLDEFFEILTWKQLGLLSKPIGILNVEGFYDHLLAHANHMVREGFVRESNLGLYCVADNLTDLILLMDAPSNQTEEKWL
ncbi:MAG: TIGR00730 family Rossman fold protein [Bacteroidota bacterium]